jgi:hypothetical protein
MEERSAALKRSQSRKDLTRRREPGDDTDEISSFYDNYYEDKTLLRAATRRPGVRTPSRSRGSSTTRSRSRDEDEYSEGEDEEFEMVTPKRAEISKVFFYTSGRMANNRSKSK